MAWRRLQRHLSRAIRSVVYPAYLDNETAPEQLATPEADPHDTAWSPLHQVFLNSLMTSFDQSRLGVTSRASFVTTIGLALAGVLLVSGDSLFAAISQPFRTLVSVGILAPLVLAVRSSLAMIAPLRRAKPLRKNDAYQPTWFFSIPTLPFEHYRSVLRGLDESSVVDLQIRQVYDIARLLRARYTSLVRATQALTLAIILFATALLVSYGLRLF